MLAIGRWDEDWAIVFSFESQLEQQQSIFVWSCQGYNYENHFYQDQKLSSI